MIVILDPDKDKNRYILKNGMEVFGASTIAGVDKPTHFLMGWVAKMVKEGKDYRSETKDATLGGTIAHFLIECYLKKDCPDLSIVEKLELPNVAEIITMGRNAFDKFVEAWKKTELTFVAGELELVSERQCFGGKLDIIARDTQLRLCLIDIKTSKSIYESHRYQLSGYQALWDENNTEPIRRRAIFRHGRKAAKTDTELKWFTDDEMVRSYRVFLTQLAVLEAKEADRK